MKIIIATGIYPPEIGGPATYAKLLTDELPKRGIQVEVLPFRIVRRYPRLVRHFLYGYKVWLKLRNADLVFTQDPVSTGVPVICAAYLAGKKMVLRVAGDYAWEQARLRFGVTDSIDDFQSKRYNLSVRILRCLQRLVVRRADVVITPSFYFTKLVSRWNTQQKKIVTIYNGIDLDIVFQREPKYGELTIISAGRLVPWKGFDKLIEIMVGLPQWRLLIAGDGPDKERLAALIKRFGVSARVTLLGSLPRSELFSHLYRAHIFVLLTTFESFSFQLVEAMHIGTPVIATDIGNIAEIITNRQNGILVKSGDDKQVIAAIEKLHNDSGFVDKLVTNAKHRAQDFSIGKTLQQLLEVFRDCL